MSSPAHGPRTTAERRVAVLCRHLPETNATPAAPLNPQQTAATPALGRPLQASYDYIIVGAGSAGCVVASRLSEDPKVSVLLIEAGGSNQNWRVRGPFLPCPLLQNSSLDWAYRTTPQETTDGRVSYWPRGKCLGGCSSINYMLYVRGDPRNYDHWAQGLGCEGWSYNDVLPFFKRSENLLGVDGSGCEAHGRGGPLQVSQMAEGDFANKDVCERMVQSCEAAGLPATKDYNGPSQRGVSLSQVTTKDGVRCDTASAFLFGTGALARPNLTVLCNANATRIALRGQEAVGVCIQKEGDAGPALHVGASKEVVVCCGAVGTPHLLMLSGLGPKTHLQEHGIDCVQDLPVGENLQDHLMWAMPYTMKPGKSSGFVPSRPLTGGLLGGLAKHVLFGKGIFSYPWVQAMAFDHTGLPGSDEAEGNDMQIHWLGFFGADPEAGKKNFGIEPREDSPFGDPNKLPSDGVTFLPSLVLPKSIGTVRLASADPSQRPIIDPKYFTHPRDMEVGVAATRLCRRIASCPPLSDVLGEEFVDTSIKHDPDSDEYIREFISRGAITIYHCVGTAKMGAADDNSAVVDPRLRVRGIRRLRVADASVMPTVISGNTNAPSIMIGERAAAFMAEERT